MACEQWIAADFLARHGREPEPHCGHPDCPPATPVTTPPCGTTGPHTAHTHPRPGWPHGWCPGTRKEHTEMDRITAVALDLVESHQKPRRTRVRLDPAGRRLTRYRLVQDPPLTPWAETPADPPRIAVEPPAAPDPASGMGAAAPGPETAAEGLCRCGLAAEVEQLRARVAELQQADLLIAHLVTTAHQWHAAYEAETSPTALADSPAYRQARVALSDAVYRLIDAGRLPEHQCGPLSATPPEPAAALGDLGVTCREVDPGSGPVEIVLSRTGDQCPSRDETTPAPPQQAVSERTLAEIIEARIRADERARIAAAWRHGVVLSGPAMHVRASNPTTTTGDDHG